MKIRELQNLIADIEKIGDSSDNKEKKLFTALKENKITIEILTFIEKNPSFLEKFIDLVEKEKAIKNRILMTFKNRNEYVDFVKAGNECGDTWYKEELIHCYCRSYALTG